MTGPAADRAATLAMALRRHRRAAGLSQERLAERSGVSVRTIRNIESGRVIAPRSASVTALADGLGIDGVERSQLSELCIDIDGHRVAANLGGQVPIPLSPLVGRDAEIKALSELLTRGGSPRLVTLTGVAGVGKSRLAMEVVREAQAGGRHAWWVPLAAIREPQYVIDAVAAVVEASAASLSAVAGRVGKQPALLALDNLEHLDGVGEVVADLLAVSPEVTVLATSRAPVGVPGEQEWLVRPLTVPADDEIDPGALASVGSVRLLVDRVRAVVPGFELTAANSPIVAEICRLLDGLPLAVELAAKQWRVRGGAGLVRSIRRDPLALHDIAHAGTNEHLSLRSALEASYSLLDDAAQRTFASLSVFPAGWDLDAAVAVAGDEAAVGHLDRLTALGLVDALAAGGDGDARFSMLPTIRAFSAARAGDADHIVHVERAAARHAEYFATWLAGVVGADPAAAAVISAEPEPAALIHAERDNLRVALDWFRDHSPAAGLAVAVSLYSLWRSQGRENEGLAHLCGLLARVGDAELAPKAQQQAAMLAHRAGRFDLAARLAGQSLAASRSRDDPRGCAAALATMGTTALVTDPAAAVLHCRAARAQAETLGDASLLSLCSERLAVALAQMGHLDDAVEMIRKAVDVAAEHGLLVQQLMAMVDEADFLLSQGNPDGADRVLRNAEPLVTSTNQAVPEAFWLATHAVTRAHLGDTDGAARPITTLAEKAIATGSKLIKDWAEWTLGELNLAVGAHEEAVVLLRRVMRNEPPQGYPLNRITVLSGLALAATDDELAAQAVCAAEKVAGEYDMRIPPAPARRLEVAKTKWIDAVGADIWCERMAAASRQTLEDLVLGITEAE